MVGRTLTTTTGSWSDSPTSYSYAWKRCDTSGASCTIISGATGAAYTAQTGDVGHTLRSTVTAHNSVGSASATSSPSQVVTTPAVTVTAPVDSVAPALSGTATVGQTLTVTTGTWSGSPTGYTYAWRDCDSSGAGCATIAGAGGPSYTLTSGDVGHTVDAVVTATNGGGSTAATSAPSAVVTAPVSTSLLLGTATVEPTQDSNGAGSAQAFSVSAAAAGTATSISVYVGSGNAASTVSAGLYGDSGGSPGALLAAGTISSPRAGAWNSVSIPATPLTAGTYWIALLGTGSTLAFNDQASGSCTTQTSSQQTLSSLPVTWSTGQTWTNAYCPVSAYVSGTPATSGGASSVSGSVTAPISATPPLVSGSPVVGQTLVASTGGWSGSPTAYAYQWRRCAAGGGCASIAGATGATYVAATADVGDTLQVQVTATNGAGSALATSAPTAPVSAGVGTAGLNCAGVAGSGTVSQASLDACGLPSMDSTGPPAGTTYTATFPNGLTISQPGTYSHLNVTGEVVVTASNVVIQDSQITDPDNSNPAIYIASGVSNVQVNYTSIHGTASSGSGALFAAVENVYGDTLNSVTLDHDQFYNGDRILVGYGTVTNSYCLGGATFGTEHDECVYTSGAAPGVTLIHDTLLNANPWQTAAVFVDSPTGCAGCTNGDGAITIEDSLLGGGAYAIYGGDGSDGSVHTGPETITNNRFTRLYFPTCGQFGLDAYVPSDVVWSGNVWDDTGQAITGP